jgi:hypothetical protein
MQGGVDWSKLPPEVFAHPADLRALSALKKLPGAEWVMRQLARHSYEDARRIALTAGALLCGRDAYPEVAELLRDLCASLDVRPPEMFFRHEQIPSARILGDSRPFIIMSSVWLEILEPEEMRCLLARLVMHQHCGHLPYLAVCDFLQSFTAYAGIAAAPLSGLRLATEEWRRLAELSCDRGALLATGDLEALRGLMLKQAGGGCGKWGGANPDALRAQEKLFNDAVADAKLGRLYRLAMYLDAGIAFSALRLGELERWAAGEEYQSFSSGDFSRSREADTQSPPEWGAFAPGMPAWGPSFADREDTRESFFDNIKDAAAGAADLAQQGAGALSKALSTFFDSLQESGK